MKILQELFGNLATFSSYAPGVETNIDLQDLQLQAIQLASVWKPF